MLLRVRSFSTNANANAFKFNKERKGYNNKLSELRKVWFDDFQVKRNRSIEERTAETERIILEKAKRLRVKRAEVILNQEKLRQEQERARKLFQEKLAKSILKQQKKDQLQVQRYNTMINTYQAEQSSWININNLENKISTDLFEKPSTTGLCTTASEYWRWHMFSMNPKRILNEDFISTYSGTSLENRMNLRGQLRSSKTVMAQDFLEPMIGTAQDRLKYRELVDKFSTMFEDTSAQPEVDMYFDYLLSKNGNSLSTPGQWVRSDDDNNTDDDDDDDDKDAVKTVDTAAKTTKRTIIQKKPLQRKIKK
eukprot:gene5321-10640_t